MAKKNLGRAIATVNGLQTVTITTAPPLVLTQNSGTLTISAPLVTTSIDGLMSHQDKVKLDAIPNDVTSNIGTITGITMNGVSKGTSGVVDLGTVITAHQDISGKVDKVQGKGLSTNDFTNEYKAKVDSALQTHQNISGKLDASKVGAANGVAELDNNGKVPSSQLPSFVDDILEFANTASFPATGESGKIYVATNNNLTYRWTGSNYVEISPSIALGETSSTAYRGDRGKVAYDHTSSTLNPHNVTKEQIGLGNVPNVTTNNQTPTYTKASSYLPLSSGEVLSTAFGKIAKAVDIVGDHTTELDTHDSRLDTHDSSIANKVDKITGKGLSTNDFTTAEKNKLSTVLANAEPNDVYREEFEYVTETNRVRNGIVGLHSKSVEKASKARSDTTISAILDNLKNNSSRTFSEMSTDVEFKVDQAAFKRGALYWDSLLVESGWLRKTPYESFTDFSLSIPYLLARKTGPKNPVCEHDWRLYRAGGNYTYLFVVQNMSQIGSWTNSTYYVLDHSTKNIYNKSLNLVSSLSAVDNSMFCATTGNRYNSYTYTGDNILQFESRSAFPVIGKADYYYLDWEDRDIYIYTGGNYVKQAYVSANTAFNISNWYLLTPYFLKYLD